MHGRTCFSVGGGSLVRRAISDEAMSEIQLKGLYYCLKSLLIAYYKPFNSTFVATSGRQPEEVIHLLK